MTPEEDKELDEKYPTMGLVFEGWDKPIVQKWFNEQDEKTQKLTLAMKKSLEAMESVKNE